MNNFMKILTLQKILNRLFNISIKLNYAKTSQKQVFALIVKNVSLLMDLMNLTTAKNNKDDFIVLKSAIHFGTKEDVHMVSDVNLCI